MFGKLPYSIYKKKLRYDLKRSGRYKWDLIVSDNRGPDGSKVEIAIGVTPPLPFCSSACCRWVCIQVSSCLLQTRQKTHQVCGTDGGICLSCTRCIYILQVGHVKKEGTSVCSVLAVHVSCKQGSRVSLCLSLQTVHMKRKEICS